MARDWTNKALNWHFRLCWWWHQIIKPNRIKIFSYCSILYINVTKYQNTPKCFPCISKTNFVESSSLQCSSNYLVTTNFHRRQSKARISVCSKIRILAGLSTSNLLRIDLPLSIDMKSDTLPRIASSSTEISTMWGVWSRINLCELAWL